LGLIGNTFHTKDIDRAIILGDSYSPDLVSIGQSEMVLGIDSGFGSSAFGIVLLEFINGQIHVKLAEEYDQVRYEDAVSKIKNILRMNQTSLNQESLELVKIYVDASAPEFIRSLKVMVEEDDSPSYIKEQLDYCKNMI
jgi:hypothetical protein